ncbi:hypothetical protein O3P69_003672 [Scylla paramamosain]|uniref:Carboxylic ester hydrolase n=2 Tax=Scylla TaxID=6760 RepID=A0AAW0UI39_SCYPA
MAARASVCLVLLGLLGLSAAADLHNSLINSSTLEVNEPRREDKERKIKTARPRDPLVVHTNTGLVRGFRRNVLGKNVDTFYGIPFAQPPVGELRYKKPVPVTPWAGILEATKLPNSCVQEPFTYFPGFHGEEMWNPNTDLSEDCLYLNIWAPAHLRESGARPSEVLVWIYGGGYMGGTTTLEVYDADLLVANTDMIITSMQYRCGAFGYLYLKMEDAPGNVGMYDQALAIKWIRNNIEFFGGDPDRITLFGESAGAGSIAVHLLSPISSHLFQRAILQSGVVNSPWSIMTREKAYDIAVKLVEDVGCNATLVTEDPGTVMSCMRTVDAATISLAQWNSYLGLMQFPSTPIVDGEFLPDEPLDMIRRGEVKKTEILIGSNLDEGTYFMLYDFLSYFDKDESTALTREQFLEILNQIFKDWSPAERESIIFQYTNWDNPDDGRANEKAAGEVVGDYFFVCPSNLFAQLYADAGGKVYYYYFNHRTTNHPWGEWMGVLHGDEIDYVFGLPLNQSLSYTAAEKDLSQRIMRHYKFFAATGRPVSREGEWPLYTSRGQQYYVWGTNESWPQIGRGPRTTACAFWNELMPILRETQGGRMCDSKMMKALNNASPTLLRLSPILLLVTLLLAPPRLF